MTDEVAKYHTLIVPLDGSALSERALPLAVELSRVSGAQLVLVRAASVSYPNESKPDAVGEAKTYLSRKANRLAKRGVRAEVAVPHSKAAEGILFEAERRQADLVLMCTHGRSGLR